jgi:hypothetical protein
MRSPLEHEPSLVAGIGLITVRWAVMEHTLVGLLSQLILVPQAADATYHAIANFSQRKDLVKTLLDQSLKSPKHREIANRLIDNIYRMWKTRNALIHSHYVYQIENDIGGSSSIIMEGPTLGTHPSSYPTSEMKWRSYLPGDDPGEYQTFRPRARRRGFGYLKHEANGSTTFVPVNKGTFGNHADKLSRRIRQITLLTRYLAQGVAPTRKDGLHSSYSKSSPRSLQSQP